MTDKLDFDSKPRERNLVKAFSIKKMILSEGAYKDMPFFLASFEVEDEVFEFVLLPEEVKRIEESCRKITDDMDIETDSLPPLEERIPQKEMFPDYH